MLYQSSQSLIEGQKQLPLETSYLFSIQAKNGLTKKEVIYCKKFKNLCKDMEWNRNIAAKLIGCTPGYVVDIWEEQQTITEDMQENLLRNTGITLSTLRLVDIAKHLKQARSIKYKEIFEKYKDASKTLLRRKKSLINKDSDNINGLVITRFTHPLLGKLLKAWRAANKETQYTVPSKIALQYTKKESVNNIYCKRDSWRNAEIRNCVTEYQNKCFFKAFKITIEQAIAPMLAYLRDEGIDPNRNIEKAIEMLDNLEVSSVLV